MDIEHRTSNIEHRSEEECSVNPERALANPEEPAQPLWMAEGNL